MTSLAVQLPYLRRCLGARWSCVCGQAFIQEESRPNVLFIAIDDLNDWTALFAKEAPIQTPIYGAAG